LSHSVTLQTETSLDYTFYHLDTKTTDYNSIIFRYRRFL